MPLPAGRPVCRGEEVLEGPRQMRSWVFPCVGLASSGAGKAAAEHGGDGLLNAARKGKVSVISMAAPAPASTTASAWKPVAMATSGCIIKNFLNVES